jgi:hypothetical protein
MRELLNITYCASLQHRTGVGSSQSGTAHCNTPGAPAGWYMRPVPPACYVTQIGAIELVSFTNSAAGEHSSVPAVLVQHIVTCVEAEANLAHLAGRIIVAFIQVFIIHGTHGTTAGRAVLTGESLRQML